MKTNKLFLAIFLAFSLMGCNSDDEDLVSNETSVAAARTSTPELTKTLYDVITREVAFRPYNTCASAYNSFLTTYEKKVKEDASAKISTSNKNGTLTVNYEFDIPKSTFSQDIGLMNAKTYLFPNIVKNDFLYYISIKRVHVNKETYAKLYPATITLNKDKISYRIKGSYTTDISSGKDRNNKLTILNGGKVTHSLMVYQNNVSIKKYYPFYSEQRSIVSGKFTTSKISSHFEQK